MGSCALEREQIRRQKPRIISKHIRDQRDNEENMMKMLQKVFHENDEDKDGFLNSNDLRRLYHKNVTRSKSKGKDHQKVISQEDYVLSFMHSADQAGDGLISFSEFVNFYKGK